MRDVILIAIISSCALVALRRPVFGLLTFVCLGFLNPHSMTWSIGRNFPLSQLVGIGTIVGYLFWSEPKRFPRQREFTLLLVLWALFGVSTVFAFYPDDALERLKAISKIFLMIVLCVSLINTEQRLRSLFYVIALSLGFYGLKAGVFVITSGGGYIVWGPEESFLEANNAIGLALVMNLPLLVYLSKTETRTWLSWIMKAMFLFSYPAIICTYSRGAWLGMIAVTTILVWRSQHRFRFLAVGGVLAIFLLPLAIQLAPEQLVKRYNDLVNYKEESSAQSRFWNWELCRRIGFARPLYGGGFNFYSTEIYAIYYPEFLDQWGNEKVWSCHSTWLTTLAEHGLSGFFLWIGLCLSYNLSLWRLRAVSKAREDLQWSIPYIEMIRISLWGFMVVGSFFDAAYFDLFYYMIAALIILKERMADALVKLPSVVTVPNGNSSFGKARPLRLTDHRVRSLQDL